MKSLARLLSSANPEEGQIGEFGRSSAAARLGRLATIRDDAKRLREARAVRSETLFMILTGPLMVLAVLGAVHWVRSRKHAANT
jgi:hypothetical protein